MLTTSFLQCIVNRELENLTLWMELSALEFLFPSFYRQQNHNVKFQLYVMVFEKKKQYFMAVFIIQIYVLHFRNTLLELKVHYLGHHLNIYYQKCSFQLTSRINILPLALNQRYVFVKDSVIKYREYLRCWNLFCLNLKYWGSVQHESLISIALSVLVNSTC